MIKSIFLVSHFLRTALVSIAGGGIIITTLATWIGKIWASKILEGDRAKYTQDLEEMKTEYQKTLEQYKSELEISRVAVLRYSEEQFRLYSNLWKTLYKLKELSETLWENPNWQNLNSFYMHLEKTMRVVGENQLLIEDGHLKELEILLANFQKFRISKKLSYDLRELARNKPNEIGEGILDIFNENLKAKEEYSSLLQKIAQAFKHQVGNTRLS